MFGITEFRAKDYARRHGGAAAKMTALEAKFSKQI
jgi:hypothetical protein